MLRYTYDSQRIYCATVDVDPFGAIPPMSAPIAPPETTGAEVAAWSGSAWVVLPERPPVPGPTLADAKAAKSTAVQAEKVRVRDGGFLVGGVLFDSDAGANVAYLNYFTRVSADPSYVVANWKASAGVWVDMNATLFAQVSSAFGANSEAAFNWQAARDAEIAAATTVEQVQAVSEHYSA